MSGVCVDTNDLGLDVLRLVGELLFELRVANDLNIVLERVSDPLLLGRRKHLARLGHVCESDRKRRQQDRTADRQAERAPG